MENALRSKLYLAALSVALSLHGTSVAAAPEGKVQYQLAHGSWSGEVCELCSCPDTINELSGTFALQKVGEENGVQTFDVLDIDWRTASRSSKAGVTGSGTFRRKGPSGREQILELNLRVGGEEMHFTSGKVEAKRDFPDLMLRVETSLKPVCRDTVFFLIARPSTPPR